MQDKINNFANILNKIKKIDNVDFKISKENPINENNNRDNNYNNVNTFNIINEEFADIMLKEMLYENENNNIYKTKYNMKLKNNIDNDIKSGHRKRMREKFLSVNNITETSDVQLLEMLFFLLYPRKDTEKIALKLIEKYHNIYNIVNTNDHELAEFMPNVLNFRFILKLIKEIYIKINKQVAK